MMYLIYSLISDTEEGPSGNSNSLFYVGAVIFSL